MDIRYSVNPKDFKRYTTEETRNEFLVQNLYQKDEVVSVYTHIDRMVILGCMPVEKTVSIDQGMDVWKVFGTTYFLERREIGIFNLGGKGKIKCDDAEFELEFEDCLYISKGTKSVTFTSCNSDEPSKFYMVSSPADRECKTTFLSMKDAKKVPAGAVENASKRIINQFIHPDVLETCKLCMGMTKLETGSVWNSMPPHTHERRMEIYTYYGLGENDSVFHMMGEGQETRHITIQNHEAVISPSWSIHSGCATSNYTFIWAMGGENQAFDDMDSIPVNTIR